MEGPQGIKTDCISVPSVISECTTPVNRTIVLLWCVSLIHVGIVNYETNGRTHGIVWLNESLKRELCLIALYYLGGFSKCESYKEFSIINHVVYNCVGDES